MTNLSRERREELLSQLESISWPSADITKRELRALLRDSACRERVEPQVIDRTVDMPEGVIGWYKGMKDYDCGYVYLNAGLVFDARTPDFLPNTPGPIYRAIVDTGDEEGKG